MPKNEELLERTCMQIQNENLCKECPLKHTAFCVVAKNYEMTYTLREVLFHAKCDMEKICLMLSPFKVDKSDKKGE